MKIFILADGTWLDQNTVIPSHIVRMYNILVTNRDYKVVYQAGVGTCTQLDNETSCILNPKVDHYINGAVAFDIDSKIKSLYKFLINIYKKGDEIHLIGFSRGAYIVRCLAGLIYNCGLPNKHQISLSNCLQTHSTVIKGKTQFMSLDEYVDLAYSNYRSRESNDHPSTTKSISFRGEWSTELDTPIKLLCCFDTVGTLGVPSIPFMYIPKMYRFFNTTVNRNVEKAIHFIAADENRNIFEPTLMNNTSNVEQYLVPGRHETAGGIDSYNMYISYMSFLYIMSYLDYKQNAGYFADYKVTGIVLKPPSNLFDFMCRFIGGIQPRKLEQFKYLDI